jgi:hypothetical protein
MSRAAAHGKDGGTTSTATATERRSSSVVTVTNSPGRSSSLPPLLDVQRLGAIDVPVTE